MMLELTRLNPFIQSTDVVVPQVCSTQTYIDKKIDDQFHISRDMKQKIETPHPHLSEAT